MVKLRTGGSLETVKSFPSARWAWLVPVGQGSRADFSCGQGVKHKKLVGQDFYPGRGWEYSRLCSVTPLQYETHLHLGSDHSVPMTTLVRSDIECS